MDEAAQASEQWQRGLATVAALLDAPTWALERSEALARAHLPPDQRGRWRGREAVLVDDRFALFEVIATTPRATMFAGVDLHTETRAAIKLVLPTPHLAACALELAREVAVLERLRHAHVITLLGHGHAGRLPYLATHFAEHGALDQWLADEPPRAARLRVLRDAALGLAAAAELDISHGDVKPSNLLVSADARALVCGLVCGLVCDWGSAHWPGSDDQPRLTSALFRPPERWADPRPRPPGDVFGLGLSIAFALRGWHAAPAAHQRPDPRIWAELASTGLEPSPLTELISRCVDPDPEARPAAAAVASALAAAAASP